MDPSDNLVAHVVSMMTLEDCLPALRKILCKDFALELLGSFNKVYTATSIHKSMNR